jgi:hypothetical protein
LAVADGVNALGDVATLPADFTPSRVPARIGPELHALDGLPLLLPVPKVAKLLGLPRSSAYRLAESGELPRRTRAAVARLTVAAFFDQWLTAVQ